MGYGISKNHLSEYSEGSLHVVVRVNFADSKFTLLALERNLMPPMDTTGSSLSIVPAL